MSGVVNGLEEERCSRGGLSGALERSAVVLLKLNKQRLSLNHWDLLVKEYLKFTLWKDNQRNEICLIFLVAAQSGAKSMSFSLNG